MAEESKLRKWAAEAAHQARTEKDANEARRLWNFAQYWSRLADEEDLLLIVSAIRLSAHVLASDPRQLAGQLMGRLLGYPGSNIEALVKQTAERKPWPWLRPWRRP